MEGEADTVVGYAVLREVVGTDFLAAVTAAHHGTALLSQRLLLFLHFHLVQAGTQHAHGFLAVLDLRFLVLAADYSIRWQVGDPNCRICGVYGLATRTRGTERVNAQVLGLDLDVYIFGLGQHCNRNCRGVDAALLLGLRNTLHPMNSA